MKGKKHSPEQVIKKLREADAMIAALRVNMTETLAPLFITVEGQEGNSHGKGYEQPGAPGGQRP